MPRKKSKIDAEKTTTSELHEIKLIEKTYPSTRADCPTVEESCPYIFCRYHLWFDGMDTSGEPIESGCYGDTDHTCCLNEIDKSPGGMDLSEIGQILGLTKQRIHQIEGDALKYLRKHAGNLVTFVDD